MSKQKDPLKRIALLCIDEEDDYHNEYMKIQRRLSKLAPHEEDQIKKTIDDTLQQVRRIVKR